MCGILTIVNTKIKPGSELLIRGCSVIRHRGPDDEGFLTWKEDGPPEIWAGEDTAASTLKHWKYSTLQAGQPFKVGFGHRRLSILDLSPKGHQPMLHDKAGLAITYNGEVYNYQDIKTELEQSGHQFKSTTDTEVILHAWEQWGVHCLDKFNGMFSFVILDYKNKWLYAVRDRFGVKPMYYYKGSSAIYIGSEIKQIKTSPDYQFHLNEEIAHQYLATGTIDHTENTFDTQIKQLAGGHYLSLDLSVDTAEFKIHKWYSIKLQKWEGSFEEAGETFRSLLTDAVRLRLISDVTVGSCLSGGLDSSSLVCLASELLKKKGDFAGQETVTACYDNVAYDEWKFALEVINKTNAHPHQVYPSFSQLQNEIDAFLWHQDEPTGSTSQFSQWAVFKKTHEVGLKVMIDGQGADEYLAGYGGNDLSLYAGLLGQAHLYSLFDEAVNYKKEKGNWPVGFLIGAMQLTFGSGFAKILPDKLKLKPKQLPAWLKTAPGNAPDICMADSLRANLLRQIYSEPLPSLLRYEDRNSMAWSVESRTPFMDYRLVEFTLGLPERFIYKRGVRKTILRQAMHHVIPEAIENRKDKMGFVTPEEVWLKGEGKEWFMKGVEDAISLCPELFNAGELRQFCGDMISGKLPFDFSIWRILAFGKWYASMTSNG